MKTTETNRPRFYVDTPPPNPVEIWKTPNRDPNNGASKLLRADQWSHLKGWSLWFAWSPSVNDMILELRYGRHRLTEKSRHVLRRKNVMHTLFEISSWSDKNWHLADDPSQITR